MRRPRLTGQAAVNDAVDRLLNKFAYPQPELGPDSTPVIEGGGGGGMAHVLIVSDSEPASVQAKADFIVSSTSSAAELQEIFDAIDAQTPDGPWSIWMAGTFELDSSVTAPSQSWIRGLGYTADNPCS